MLQTEALFSSEIPPLAILLLPEGLNLHLYSDVSRLQLWLFPEVHFCIYNCQMCVPCCSAGTSNNYKTELIWLPTQSPTIKTSK